MIEEYKKKEVLSLIKDEPYKSYFFRKAKNPEWLNILFQEGFLSPEQFPTPEENREKKGYFYFPHWPALDYLERVSEQLKNLNDRDKENYTKILLNIIRDTTNYHIKNNKKLDNFRIWTSFTRILSNISNEKIEGEELEFFIKNWLDSNFSTEMQFIEIGEKLLPKFLNSNNEEDIKKAEIIIINLTQVKWYSKYSEKQLKELEENKELSGLLEIERDEPKLLASEYWFYKIFNENKELIAEKVSDNVILIFADRLIEIFEKKYKGKFDYSNIWFRTIKDETEPDEVEQTIALILRNIIKFRASKKDINQIIYNLISDKYFDYPFFKRLVIFLIAENFEVLKNIFKTLLEKEGSLYFNNIIYEPELYYLLEKNADKLIEFSDNIINIIENKVPNKDIEINDKIEKEKIISTERLKWLLPLKNNKIFKEYYDKYLKIVGEEPKPYFMTPQTFIGPGPSPLRKEEILNMDDKKLVDYIKNFNPQRKLPYHEEPTRRGFSEILRISVKENLEKFILNFDEYTQIPFFYFADVLWGIYDALNDNKINIENIKKFVDNIVKFLKTDDFWNDAYYLKPDNFDTYHVDHLSILSIAFIIFDKIIRQKNVEDDIDIISIIWNISLEIVNKLMDRKEIGTYKDNYEFTNSTLSNIIRVLIKLVELNKKYNNFNKIINDFNDIFEKLFKNNYAESIFWFGADFPFLYYINKEWSNKAIIQFIRTDNQKWEVFILGNSWNNKFDYDSYVFLRDDYEKALDYNFKKDDDKIKSILVQKIALSYLYKKEDLDSDSLFSKLINKCNYKYIEEVLDFFWRIEDKKNKETSERIIKFWKYVYEKRYKNKSSFNANDKKILSEFTKLTVFLEEINEENFKWLEISASFVKDINSSFFIEYLNKIKNSGNSYKYLARIFKEILNSTTPFYKKEDIRSIIEFLYQKAIELKNEELAKEVDDIINTYAEREYEFLDDLYKKYRKAN